MSRTRVKICGLTDVDAALHCAAVGADAVGLVFHAPSSRAVSVEQAREIALALPPFVTVVALFLDAPEDEIRRTLERVPADMLQFHGRESAAFCGRFGRRYLKSLPMAADVDPVRFAATYPHASGFLLDSHELGAAGGTGRTFDWDRYPHGMAAALMLAGGLNPGNVAAAVRATRPWAVDVSSGVESAPGIKDPRLVEAFIDEVHRVERD